jgi:hypothetical protein
LHLVESLFIRFGGFFFFVFLFFGFLVLGFFFIFASAPVHIFPFIGFVAPYWVSVLPPQGVRGTHSQKKWKRAKNEGNQFF